MDFSQLVSGVAERLQLVGLEPDEDGRCVVVFDDKLEVEIRQLDSSRLLIQYSLGTAPTDDFKAEEFFRTLLQRNLTRLPEQRESIALEPDTRNVILYRITTAHDLQQLSEVLEAFLNSAETWSQFEDGGTQGTSGGMMPFQMLRP